MSEECNRSPPESVSESLFVEHGSSNESGLSGFSRSQEDMSNEYIDSSGSAPEGVDEQVADKEESNESDLPGLSRCQESRITNYIDTGGSSPEGSASVSSAPECSSSESLVPNRSTSESSIPTSSTLNTSESEEYLQRFNNFKSHRVSYLPNLNLPEKIILVVDRAADYRSTPFITREGRCKPFEMLKRVVQRFILLKSMLSKNHQFTIVQLNENSTSWNGDFTNDRSVLLYILNRLRPCAVEDTLELGSLFECILSKVDIPPFVDISYEHAPKYIVRTVLFYGRSYPIPNLNYNHRIRELFDNPYFLLDVLMTHEPLDRRNHSKKILNVLQSLEKKEYGYFFPVARDENRLYLCMAKLLAHPLQRSLQEQPESDVSIISNSSTNSEN